MLVELKYAIYFIIEVKVKMQRFLTELQYRYSQNILKYCAEVFLLSYFLYTQ